MPHLLKPRKGWENERLASYLLLGSALSRTRRQLQMIWVQTSSAPSLKFKTCRAMTRSYREAPFAIQIKSSTSDV